MNLNHNNPNNESIPLTNKNDTRLKLKLKPRPKFRSNIIKISYNRNPNCIIKWLTPKYKYIAAASCFAIGACTEIYTARYSNNGVGTGLGWGTLAAIIVLS